MAENKRSRVMIRKERKGKEWKGKDRKGKGAGRCLTYEIRVDTLGVGMLFG